ncbi:histidine phosphatase family protein [Sulfurimonas sp.]|uniref:histidine phosphatase family protein n=1 Tax=Sulfurimonas sp. TaxID=2022749 RepID=UPI002613112C|nr:histidine phosphatase family protein [Sulfurimonas sp.]
MKITLVRHTEVEEKYHKKYNGHINIGLSKRGQTQSQELGSYFANKEFDLIYCSDLKRAKDTLAAFRHSKDAIYTEKLREKSWGKHEGLSFDEIIAQNEIKYENFEQWINALDGEPYEEYIERIKIFFFEFLPTQKGENILIVTHAGVIRVLMVLVQKLSLEDAFCIDIPYSAYVIYNTNLRSFSTIKY